MSRGSDKIVLWSARSGQRNVFISCDAKSIFLSKIRPWRPWKISLLWHDSQIRLASLWRRERGSQGRRSSAVEVRLQGPLLACFRVITSMFGEDSLGSKNFLPEQQKKEMRKDRVVTVFSFDPWSPTFNHWSFWLHEDTRALCWSSEDV